MEETQNKEPEARHAWEFPNDIIFHNKNTNNHTQQNTPRFFSIPRFKYNHHGKPKP
jgi:hypothetical protein